MQAVTTLEEQAKQARKTLVAGMHAKLAEDLQKPVDEYVAGDFERIHAAIKEYHEVASVLTTYGSEFPYASALYHLWKEAKDRFEEHARNVAEQDDGSAVRRVRMDATLAMMKAIAAKPDCELGDSDVQVAENLFSTYFADYHALDHGDIGYILPTHLYCGVNGVQSLKDRVAAKEEAKKKSQVSDRDRDVLRLIALHKIDADKLKTVAERLAHDGEMIGLRKRVETPAIETMYTEMRKGKSYPKDDVLRKLYCLSDADVENAAAVYNAYGVHALYSALENHSIF